MIYAQELRLRTKGAFLIFLFTGHETTRIIENIYGLDSGPDKNGDPEGDWQRENSACTWSFLRWGCRGAAPNMCSFRHLRHDRLPPFSSQSCRLKDEYMLATDRRKYFQLQAQLLAKKAEKLAKYCGPDGRLQNSRCHRRAKHIFRAIIFMSKAQRHDFVANLTETEKNKDKELFQDSLDHMAKFAGPDAEFIQLLVQHTIDKQKDVQRKPMESVQEVVRLLYMLLRGSEQDKEKARADILQLSPVEAGSRCISRATRRRAATDCDGLSQDKCDLKVPSENQDLEDGYTGCQWWQVDTQETEETELAQELDSRMDEISKGLDSEAKHLDDESFETETVLRTLQEQATPSISSHDAVSVGKGAGADDAAETSQLKEGPELVSDVESQMPQIRNEIELAVEKQKSAMSAAVLQSLKENPMLLEAAVLQVVKANPSLLRDLVSNQTSTKATTPIRDKEPSGGAMATIKRELDVEAKQLDKEAPLAAAVLRTISEPKNSVLLNAAVPTGASWFSGLLAAGGDTKKDNHTERPHDEKSLSEAVQRNLATSDPQTLKSFVVSAVSFVAIVMLVVVSIVWGIPNILSAIVSWAVLSVLTCGAYAQGNNLVVANHGLPIDQRIGILNTTRCISSSFAKPFRWAYWGVNRLSEAIRGQPLSAGRQYSQEPPPK